jgi:uncharacterized membrane protein YeaQ/YmgE (transglycosylase-associated protein family)
MEPMNLLVLLVIGVIAGWMAAQVISSPFDVIGNAIVGAFGALIGSLLFEAFGEPGASGLDIYSILIAFVGAVILLVIISALKKGRL